MGQAAIDLPDPLDRLRPDAVKAPAADDLLSQMAGDEIERLLGAAGVETPTPSATTPPAPASAPRSPVPDPSPIATPRTAATDPNADLLPDTDELPTSADAEIASTPASKPDEDPGMQAELDALFDQINGSNPSDSPTREADSTTTAAEPGVESVAAAEKSAETSTESPAIAAAEVKPESATADAASTAALAASTDDGLNALFEQIQASDAQAGRPTPAGGEAAGATPSASTGIEAASDAKPAEPATEADDLDDALEPPGEPLDGPDEAPAGTAPVASASAGTGSTTATTASATPGTHEPAGAGTHASPAAGMSADAISDRPSLLVRVLKFINAPFNSLSEGVRDVLGKIAILTVLNAIAVLVYVLFFRGK